MFFQILKREIRASHAKILSISLTEIPKTHFRRGLRKIMPPLYATRATPLRKVSGEILPFWPTPLRGLPLYVIYIYYQPLAWPNHFILIVYFSAAFLR